MTWVDDDEGVKRRKKYAKSSEDENDSYGDGLPPITGPSVFEVDEKEAKTLISTKDDGTNDDFWKDDVF